METTITAVRETTISELLELAIAGLESMYDSEQRLFCHRLIQTPAGMVREGISQRYTVMTVLGLLRARAAGLRIPFDIEATVDALLSDTKWVDNLGDLGLLLWLAVIGGVDEQRFYARFDWLSALERYADARSRSTMELSWLLTGLSQARIADKYRNLPPLAQRTYRLLCANQGDYGLFGHSAKWHSLKGMVRGRIGSFADQVYPIIAMSLYSQAFGIKAACERALRCGEAICNLQGSMGQWWWHYDSRTGRVVEHYPAYSVHQHAMAPMALLALKDASGVDFASYIGNGLEWISGANELQQDLKDNSANVVWRCIRPTNTHLGRVRSLAGKTVTATPMQVLKECRPYELGWLLYAFA